MASSDSEEESSKIIPWTEELGEENLAELERKLEIEAGVEFEDSDFDKRGVTEEKGKSFYFGVTETVELFDEDIQVTINKNDSTYTVEYWSETPEMHRMFREFISDFIEEEDGGVLLEPYEIKDRTDIEVSKMVETIEQDLELEGPLARPGSGNAKRYPVRAEHLDLSDRDGYQAKAFSVLGDGMYKVNGVKDVSLVNDIKGKVTIKPQKRDTGLYTVKAKGEDMNSLSYIVDTLLKGSQRYDNET